MGLAVAQENVLRLKIAVHQDARETGQPFRRFPWSAGESGQLAQSSVEGQTKTTAEAILKEIMLLPKIKCRVELRR